MIGSGREYYASALNGQDYIEDLKESNNVSDEKNKRKFTTWIIGFAVFR